MVFTSINFFLFFIIVILAFYLSPIKYRYFILLAAGYLFYLNIKPVFVLLLIGVTLSTWIFTSLINSSKSDDRKKIWMRINIVLVLLPLFFFKYFGQINSELLSFFATLHLNWPIKSISLLLPIGISFYTFMAIGYTIDVYNEEVEYEKNPAFLALFISFFPLLLSGPIERAQNIIPQLKKNNRFTFLNFSKGAKLMLWGYFMKLVVADRLGIYVDTIYNNIDHHNGTSILLASILYPFQIYADLGGYSLIAIGSAKIMGIDVIHNFNRPFFATSMSELWRKWHISLISWLTDYVYTPLSFSFRKYKQFGIVLSLMITFFISGIWHGASINYLIWGLIQGLFLSTEALTNKHRTVFEKKYNLDSKWYYSAFMMMFTFFLFAVSQVFGRSSDFSIASQVFEKIAFHQNTLFIGSPSTLIFGFLGLILLLGKDFIDEYYAEKIRLFSHKNQYIRILSYSFIFILILLFGVFDGGQFIYFQF